MFLIVRRASGRLSGFGVMACLLVLWQVLSSLQDSAYFPTIMSIASSFQSNWLSSDWPIHIVPSLQRMLAGYTIAVIIGVVLGILLASFDLLREPLQPLIEFLRSVPPPALIPLAIIVLGIGDASKVALIAFTCIWPILLNTVGAIRGLDTVLLDSIRIFRVTGAQKVWAVLLPGALPRILAGARTSLGLSLIMVVVSELVGSTEGIGHFVIQAQRTFSFADMWSGVFLIGFVGYALNRFFLLGEEWLLKVRGLQSRNEVISR